MITDFIIPLSILTGLGLLFGIILAFAYTKFRVYEDPRLDVITDMLPGANCGACGEPGCRAFAEKVVSNQINPSKCTVSSASGIQIIADYLGVTPDKEEKRVARLLCAGGINESPNVADYGGGMTSCRGESVVAGGIKDCSWGCLGLGDCEEVCDFDAIQMNSNKLPVVDADKCTACGDCVEICPKGLFELMPVSYKLIVQCRSLLEGESALSACRVACTACSRCVSDSAPGVIEIKNNLAVINYQLNILTSEASIKRCPTDAIVWLEGINQFENLRSFDLPLGRVEIPFNQEEYYQ